MCVCECVCVCVCVCVWLCVCARARTRSPTWPEQDYLYLYRDRGLPVPLCDCYQGRTAAMKAMGAVVVAVDHVAPEPTCATPPRFLRLLVRANAVWAA